MARIVVVGAGVQGQEGFSRKALEEIDRAQVLAGRPHHLALFPDFSGEKVVFHDGPTEIVEHLRAEERRVVVLSSGDPLFFGIGSQLLRNLPEEMLEFIPNVTFVQYAFSKIHVSWDDALFVSIVGRDLRAEVDRLVAADKVAILTDRANSPGALAMEMISRGQEGYKAYLCENLGTEKERITVTDIRGLCGLPGDDPNLIILIRKYDGNRESCHPVLGIPDEEFKLPRHILTQEEIRILSLGKLRLRHESVLWDIGAGSGSVSIEADNLVRNGRIFAIEKDAERVEILRSNIRGMNSRKVVVVKGAAPACLENLPDPDRVFVGGAGGRLQEVLEAVDSRLRPEGRVVVNAVALETLFTVSEFFEKAGYRMDVTAVNISRTNPATEYRVFEAINPVYMVTAQK